MSNILPPEEYYKTLATKPMGAGVLFLNRAKEILLVKPSYKKEWQIPGGMLDKDESPRAAAVRETGEELGLLLGSVVLPLLCVDWMPAQGEVPDHLQFIFFGGILTPEIIASIKLQPEELDEYRFLPLDKAKELSSERLRRRLDQCLLSIKSGQAVYLENGL